ncbi:MAG: hypothetical protein IJN54_01715 [Lachnospiraceae bacterium]|nr:hypothetical protein [Lachnospiraceae bacterium]
MEQEINMSVSSICMKDGEKYAFVSFTDGKRIADGKIPACKIVSNKGFSQKEVEQLETYMQRELPKLKRLAAGIRVIDAIIK